MAQRTSLRFVKHWTKGIQSALAGVLLCGLAGGCLTTPSFFTSVDKFPPCGQPTVVATRWENRVIFTHNIVGDNMGEKLPGLAGRMYLFGADQGRPITAEGTLHVDAFDNRAVAQGGAPVWLGAWNIDPATFKRLLTRDDIGWGYTLFLPWPRTDVNQVHLRLRFTPEGGNPLFDECESMTLNKEDRPVFTPAGVTHHQVPVTQQARVPAAMQARQ